MYSLLRSYEGPVLCLLINLSTVAQTWGNDWPEWRGAENDGVAVNASPPATWSAERNIAWKARVPGVGHSSPIVSGGCVFLTTCIAERNERRLLCFDRESGDLSWSTTIAECPIEGMHSRNTPASSTPAADGKQVYSTFAARGEYLIAAVDRQGGVVWRRTLGPVVSHHGFHSPPILEDDSLLLAGLQDSHESFVTRLHAVSGEVIWQTRTGTNVRSFSPPCVVRNGGSKRVIVSGANCTMGFSFETGGLLWRTPGPAEKTVSSIVQADGRVLVSGGRDSRLLALDDVFQESPTVAWVSSTGAPYVPSPIVAQGSLHMVSDNGVYTRVNPVTGETAQQKRLLRATSASPIYTAGKLYLTDETGVTIVAELSPSLNVLAKNDIGEPVYASLAPAGDDLLIRSESHLFCVREE